MKFVNIIVVLLSLLTLSSCGKGDEEILDDIWDLYHSKKSNEALLMLNSVYSQRDWTFRAYTTKIELLLDLGMVGDAKRILSNMQSTGFDRFKDYNQMLYYYHYGLVFYHLGDFHNADRYFGFATQNIELTITENRATRTDTSYYAVSNLNRGLCNINLLNYQAALDLFDTALIWYKKYKEKEGIINVFYKKSHCYENMDNISEALANLDSALKYEPDFYSAYIKKGLLLQRKEDYTSAINCYQQAIKYKEKDFTAFYHLGLTYKMMHNYAKALENLDIASSLQHNKVDILVEQAKIYKIENDSSNYLNMLMHIIELDSENEYAQEFISKNNIKKIYKINEGLVYDFTDIKNY